jgi:hypothetical protein
MAYRGHHYAIHEEDDFLPDYMGVDFALGKRAKGKGKDKLADGDGKAGPSRAPSVASATSTRAASKSRSETGSSKGHGKQKGGDHNTLFKALQGAKSPETMEAVLKAYGMGTHGGGGKGKGEKKKSKPMRKWKILLANDYATPVAGETDQQRYARARKYIQGFTEEDIDGIVERLEAKLGAADATPELKMTSTVDTLHKLSSSRIVWLKQHLPDTAKFWDIFTDPQYKIRGKMAALKTEVVRIAGTWHNAADPKKFGFTVSTKINTMQRKADGDTLLSEKSYEALCRKWVLRNSKRYIKNGGGAGKPVSEADQAEYTALLGKIKDEVEKSQVRELSAQLAFFQALKENKFSEAQEQVEEEEG